MEIGREHIKRVLENEGFVLNSFNQKTATFQNKNIKIIIEDLNCKLYD